VMQLVDAGKVALDAPVQRYLPQFQLADPDAAARITVRQLLTHTSGLPVSACEREVSSIDDFVRTLRTVKIDRPIGSRHVYCSGNYNILGAMVQQISGEPFGSYLQQHIFQPLEMRHSYTSDVPARQDGLGQGHRWIFGFNRPMDYFNPSGVPAGYVISTAEDMTHFLIAQANGGTYQGKRLLSSKALSSMQQPAVDAGDGSSYGLGWQQGRIAGVPMVYHLGGNYNMETVAMMDPRTHRAVVLLINTQGLLGTGAFRSIEGGVARLLDDQPTGPAAMPIPTVYAIVDSVLVALTALTLLPLFRLARRAASSAHPAGPRRHCARVVVRIVAELAGGLLLLAATGLFAAQLGATWWELAMLIPDLLVWVWVISGLLILTAVLRAVTAVAPRMGRRGVAPRSVRQNAQVDTAKINPTIQQEDTWPRHATS
jgi:CubicO group peptidase (beta-lactamase class C family)